MHLLCYHGQLCAMSLDPAGSGSLARVLCLIPQGNDRLSGEAPAFESEQMELVRRPFGTELPVPGRMINTRLLDATMVTLFFGLFHTRHS